MRKLLVVCDLCGKEIEEDAYKMTLGTAERTMEGKTVRMVPMSIMSHAAELERADYCEGCMKQLADMLIDLIKTKNAEELQEETKEEAAVKVKELEYGKVFQENGINYMMIQRTDSTGTGRPYKLDVSKFDALVSSGWSAMMMKREFSLDSIEQAEEIEMIIELSQNFSKHLWDRKAV